MNRLKGTVENIEIERGGIEAGVEVVIEDVARRIDVGAGVGGELHLGEIRDRSVLHAPSQPHDAADSVGGLPRRQVRVVPVAYVDDAAASVHLGDEIVCGGGSAGLIEPVGRRIRRVGGGGGEREQQRAC